MTHAQVAVLYPRRADLVIVDVRLPEPGPTDVVVDQSASGVCHSQLNQIRDSRRAHIAGSTTPLVLGHESRGIVRSVGRRVSHVRPGDEVFLTWINRAPRPEYREPVAATVDLGDGGPRAVAPDVFTWATHTVADERFVVKAPDGAERTFSSVIGCAVVTGAGAVNNSVNVRPGDRVAVWGAGGVGLCAIAAAKRAGATTIVVVDLDDAKLELAKNFGATHVVNASRVEPVAAVRESAGVRGGAHLDGVDFAFDCIGAAVTINQSINVCRAGWAGGTRGGTAVLVGVPTTSLTLDPTDILLGEKRLVGSLGGSSHPDRDLPELLALHVSGELDLSALVTVRARLEDINDVLAELDAGRIVGRAVIEFD